MKKALESGRLKSMPVSAGGVSGYSYEKAIAYLLKIDGNTEKVAHQIKEGSMPEPSLNFCGAYIESLYKGEPLLGLHIGNFVGVSLAFFTNLVKNLDPGSLLVSIDPNIQHRGIRNPINSVIGLLNKFNLQDNSMVLTGYSLELNPYKARHRHEDKVTSVFDKGLSCAQQLKKLQVISSSKFDFCVIDGNHNGSYLKREIEEIDRLLKPGGLLILDDVSPDWDGVQEAFETIDETRYRKAGANNRVGILEKLA
jgi:hypothetical protein